MNIFQPPEHLLNLVEETTDEEWFKGQKTLYYYFKNQLESYEIEDRESAESNTCRTAEVYGALDKNGKPLFIPDPDIIHYNKSFDKELLKDVFQQLEELHPLIEVEFRNQKISRKLISLLQQFHYYRGFIESLAHFEQDDFRNEKGLKSAHIANSEKAIAEKARKIWVAKMLMAEITAGKMREASERDLAKHIALMLDSGNGLTEDFDREWFLEILKTDVDHSELKDKYSSRKLPRNELNKLASVQNIKIPPVVWHK